MGQFTHTVEETYSFAEHVVVKQEVSGPEGSSPAGLLVNAAQLTQAPEETYWSTAQDCLAVVIPAPKLST